MGISEATKQKLEDNLNKALEKETPESFNKFLDEQNPADKVETNLLAVERAKEMSPFMRSGFEQNPADKVEPKFKIGDWIANDVDSDYVYHVESVGVCYHLRKGGALVLMPFIEEKYYHLWTIQDAKDGDTLSDGCTLFIFKEVLSDGSIMTYCDYYKVFTNVPMNLTCSQVHPATKEQRDTLEKAMADAGYTFDFEKKELKKIEQKPADTEKGAKGNERDVPISAWSEEDEEMIEGLSNCLDELEKENGWHYVYVNNENVKLTKFRKWLKSLKERMQPQPKQEWSEDTQQWIDAIIKDYEGWYDADKDHMATIQVKINILKSLKERCTWKPSDEQMDAVKDAIDYLGCNTKKVREYLMSLYEQLKKLKE